jgi:hypothetical protein
MRAVALALAALACAVPAAAQDEDGERKRDRFLAPDSQIGTRFLRAPETAQESEARERQKRLARCIFYGRKDEVREVLANSDFDRIDFAATRFTGETFFDELDFTNCLGRAMKNSQYKIYVTMPYGTLRNLLAEEAYLHDNKDAPVLAAGAPTVIKARFALTKGGPRAGALAEVADCITYRDAARAHAFLTEIPGTKGETEALEALGPTLITCLDVKEAPKLSTSMVRQMIADGLWSRSHHGAFAAVESAGKEAGK